MTEHYPHAVRINELLPHYWEELKAGHPLPLEQEINPDSLGEAWDWCYLVSIRGDVFAYDYLGRSLLDAYGDDLTGREISETLVYPHPPSLLATFRKVTASSTPALDENQFHNSQGALVKYRSCVTPYGAFGRTGVQFLLGGMRWKSE